MRRGAFCHCFGQEPAQERTIHLDHVRQVEIEHIADGLLHGRMVPPDVKNAVAAQEVEIWRVIHIIQIGAFGPGIDFVETDYALGRDQGPVQMAFVQLVVLA